MLDWGDDLANLRHEGEDACRRDCGDFSAYLSEAEALEYAEILNGHFPTRPRKPFRCSWGHWHVIRIPREAVKCSDAEKRRKG